MPLVIYMQTESPLINVPFWQNHPKNFSQLIHPIYQFLQAYHQSSTVKQIEKLCIRRHGILSEMNYFLNSILNYL